MTRPAVTGVPDRSGDLAAPAPGAGAGHGRAYSDEVRPETQVSTHPEFEDLVRELTSDVWLLCRHLGDVDAAEDLTQETFLRVHTALPGFRGDSSPRTWVFSIARRVCADHVRRRQRERALTERVASAARVGPATVPAAAGELALWGLVGELPTDRRAAFVLTQVFGLSYQEAATVCDCAIGTIRSRVARARADLIEAHIGRGRERRPSAAERS
jgi:RNA polymerase sigma-70 factor (ECF subfamily)